VRQCSGLPVILIPIISESLRAMRQRSIGSPSSPRIADGNIFVCNSLPIRYNDQQAVEKRPAISIGALRCKPRYHRHTSMYASFLGYCAPYIWTFLNSLILFSKLLRLTLFSEALILT
jgi:hypothetical protein